MKVKLSEIVDAMDMQMDESSHYLNLETGEITYITDEEISYLVSFPGSGILSNCQRLV